MSTAPKKVLCIYIALPRTVPDSKDEVKFGLNEEEASHHVGQMLLFTLKIKSWC